ncbi:MAG: Abnormal spindle-like microcephaly-assocd, ASPM-SPD-2-Hydin [Thermoanaerobaculia bacterium]|jgi:hypothetical protein|nr:Abnormal spindle-like microcephaly-assocd, ASPM-SPD-2-Hydin [Thermoanaerobaculia bacterium]
MRTITIDLRDFVDETKRRERRGGGVIVAIGALIIAGIVARPVEKKSPQLPVVTQTIPQQGVMTIPVSLQPASALTPQALQPSSLPIPLADARAVAVPQSLRFEALTAGGSSAAELLVVRNAGEQPLAIRHVASSGAAFRVTNGCSGGTLERGASCSVAVVFSPPRAGEHTGIVTVATNGGTLTIPLHGASRAAGRAFPARLRAAANRRKSCAAARAIYQQRIVAGVDR